jgi:hypothetical protein
MFKEILKIIPQVENRDLQKMERSLGRRFGRIAKKFGKVLTSVLTKGSLVGLGLALINKIVNPLQAVQESIDRILNQGDDLRTFAETFNTTAGKLAKLTAFGEATGLDRDFLFQLLSKFQVRLAETEADPNLRSPLRQFVGREDTADAFFDFIQNLKQLSKSDSALAQKLVFGDDALIRAADFIQSDLSKLNEEFFKGISTKAITEAATRSEGLSNLQNALKAQRNLTDFIGKSKIITEKVINDQNTREKLNLQREQERIKSYESISLISETTEKIFNIIEKGFLKLTDLVVKVTQLADIAKKLAPSSVFRGIGNLFGGDDD